MSCTRRVLYQRRAEGVLPYRVFPMIRISVPRSGCSVPPIEQRSSDREDSWLINRAVRSAWKQVGLLIVANRGVEIDPFCHSHFSVQVAQ